MANNCFICTALIGGTAGCLDDISVDYIEDEDCAFVIDHANRNYYLYTYESGNSDAESSPTTIIPDDNSSGTGAWRRCTEA